MWFQIIPPGNTTSPSSLPCLPSSCTLTELLKIFIPHVASHPLSEPWLRRAGMPRTHPARRGSGTQACPSRTCSEAAPQHQDPNWGPLPPRGTQHSRNGSALRSRDGTLWVCETLSQSKWLAPSLSFPTCEMGTQPSLPTTHTAVRTT